MSSDSIPRANADDIQQLVARYASASARDQVENWPDLARALVREARRYGLTIPPYLAHAAGYRGAPPPLNAIEGGKAAQRRPQYGGRTRR